MERLSMRKIKDVMRLGSQGLSARKIAASLGISRGAVAAYADRAQAAGLTWPLPVELTEGDLESLLFPASVQVLSATFPQPDWAQVHIELRRKGVTHLRCCGRSIAASTTRVMATAAIANFIVVGKATSRR